jgi:hypothetical protein
MVGAVHGQNVQHHADRKEIGVCLFRVL